MQYVIFENVLISVLERLFKRKEGCSGCSEVSCVAETVLDGVCYADRSDRRALKLNFA